MVWYSYTVNVNYKFTHKLHGLQKMIKDCLENN